MTMIALPDLPRTFTARQIECVSCHEHFSLAEEFIEDNQRTRANDEERDEARIFGSRWRLPSDHNSDTQLRFQETRIFRSIIPQNRAEPNWKSFQPFSERNDDTYINCPRCGADNRNWLQITNHPTGRSILNRLVGGEVNSRFVLNAATDAILFVLLVAAVMALISLVVNGEPDVMLAFLLSAVYIGALVFLFVVIVAYSDRLFKQVDNGLITIGTMLSLLLALFAFLFYSVVANHEISPDRVLSRSIPLGTATFLVGFISACFISDEWREVLYIRRLRRFLPQVSQQIGLPISLRIGLISLFIFVFVLPVLGYWVLPLGRSFIFDRFDSEPQLTPRQSIEVLQTRIEEWRLGPGSPEVVDESLEGLSRALEEFLATSQIAPSQIETVESMIHQLEAQNLYVPEALRGTMQATINNLSLFVEENRLLTPEGPEPRVPFELPREFLSLWIAFVGTSGLIATLLSAWGVEIFVARVDAQVPPPVFHSVANLTRVVVWEAKHALEIPGDMQHIQWMRVDRNNQGGIDLIGLYRDLPDFDAEGRPTSDKVRAQRYIISTDRLGRIISASISDIRAAYAAGSPGFVVRNDQWQGSATPASARSNLISIAR